MLSKISNVLLLILLIAIGFCAVKTYELEQTKRTYKTDFIELSDIKYGMFNVDVWEQQFAEIITKKLKDLKLTGKNREKTRDKIKSFLYESIDKFEKSYKKENDEKGGFTSSLRNFGADFFNIFGEFKERVPTITEDILNFLENKENRDAVKNYILTQVEEYKSGTFQKIDYSTYNSILKKYNSTTKDACKDSIMGTIDKINVQQLWYNGSILMAYISILLLVLFFKTRSILHITLYVLAAFILLLLGVFLPMIDIDARIGSMEFELMGEPIAFKDQVLYYKSKSIMEMSQIMLSQGQIKVILVGILVLLFSVIFPVSKLISSLLLMFKRTLKNNKIINFLVFKSGKWSMADVMVVAIFMSYIGFSGIISSQLEQLESISYSLNILTTNHSELQYGFFFFLGFVILSIAISQRIKGMLAKAPAEITKSTSVI